MGPSLKDLGRIVAEQSKKAAPKDDKPAVQKKGRNISYHKHTDSEKRHNQPVK